MKRDKEYPGFSVIELLVILLVVCALAFMGLYIYKIHNPVSSSANTGKSLKYKSEHYSFSLQRDVDNNLAGKYNLKVSFNDSFDSASPCPTVKDGFIGSISSTNVEANSMSLTISQNAKPYSLPSKTTATCALEVVFQPYTQKFTFDKSWLQTGSSQKTLKIQGRNYNLFIDKQNYNLALSDGNTESDAPLIPDGIGGLFTYPACKTLDELKTYATQNGIQVASTKYPDLETKLLQAGRIQINTNQYNQELLVIGNAYFKNLLNKKGLTSDCQVWAAKTPLVYTQGTQDITIE